MQRPAIGIEPLEIRVGGLGLGEIVGDDVEFPEHRRRLLGPGIGHALELGGDRLDEVERLGEILGLVGGNGLHIFRGRIHAHFLHAAQGEAELALADEEIEGLAGGGHADHFHRALLVVGGDDDILSLGG
ncbi:MAG: hypothetical protein WDN28_05635 [Chthoniobacter sp.]